MNEAQNGTKPIQQTLIEDKNSAKLTLSPAQLSWIEFTACQGMIVNPDGTVKKMNVDEFSEAWKVPRRTLYNWRKSIPNFWELVGQEVMNLWNGNRTVKVVNAMFIAATVKLDVRAQQTWLANQKLIEFRMPTQEVKHEAGSSWAALLNKRRNQATIQEGTVVDDTTAS